MLDENTATAVDEKQACFDAYVEAQRAKKEDKLQKARENLLICTRPVCPARLSKDCMNWASEVDQAMPTIVVEAQGPDGTDAVNVRVIVDGMPFQDQIDGKSKAIDPGAHSFRFETEGAEPVEQKIIILTGQKIRKVAVKFSPRPTPHPATSTPVAPESDSSATGLARPIPPLVYVLGGLGLAGVGAFGYLAVKFDGQVADLDKCKGQCEASKVDDASATRQLAFVPLGIGVVSLGVATYLYLQRPSVPEPTSALRRLDFKTLPGGAMATFGSAF